MEQEPVEDIRTGQLPNGQWVAFSVSRGNGVTRNSREEALAALTEALSQPERCYFSEAEAQGKVGRRIMTTVEFSGVPSFTEGDVTRADEGTRGWTVGITWNIEREPLSIGEGSIAGERFLAITGGKPLTDWFSRDEYDQYLIEIGQGQEEQ